MVSVGGNKITGWPSKKLTAKLSILRAKTTVPEEFRRNMQEIAMLILCEAGTG